MKLKVNKTLKGNQLLITFSPKYRASHVESALKYRQKLHAFDDTMTIKEVCDDINEINESLSVEILKYIGNAVCMADLVETCEREEL